LYDDGCNALGISEISVQVTLCFDAEVLSPREGPDSDQLTALRSEWRRAIEQRLAI